MFWKFAFKNLFRNLRRSVSTGLAICIGFVGLNLLGAYIYRTKKAIDMVSIYSAQRGHFLIFKKDGFNQYDINPKKYVFSKAEQQQVNSILDHLSPNIEFVGRQLQTTGLLSYQEKSHPVIIYGVDPIALAKSFSHPDMLDWASDWVLPSQKNNPKLFQENPELISLTPMIENLLKIKRPLFASDSLQVAARSLDGDLNAVNTDLGGLHTTGLQFMEDTIVLISLAKMQELLATESILSFSVFLKNTISPSYFEILLKKILPSLPFETEIYKFDNQEINPFHKGTMGFLYVMTSFFVLLIGTAVSLTLINSLTMGIIERTRELGTLRALGFEKKNILNLFLKETFLLCFISMSIGVLISYLISKIVNSSQIMFFPPAASQPMQFILRWNLWIALTVFVFLMTVALISSLIVTQKKLNKKIVSLIHDSGDQ